MTSVDHTADTAPRSPAGPHGDSALALWAGLVAAAPYLGAVQTGPWIATVLGMVFVVVLCGGVLRLTLSRLPQLRRDLIVLGAQVLTTVCALTLFTMPTTAILGLIPTGSTASTFSAIAQEAYQEVLTGVAPVADTLALRTMLAAGFAVLMILVDQCIALRIPLPAVVLVAAAGATPTVVTFGEASILWFLVFAVTALLMLRSGTAADRGARPRRSWVMTAGIGAAAIAVVLVVTPLVPVSSTWFGLGGNTSINPTLQLGEDLRRPDPTEVLRLTTTASAPYLRIATLSQFNGSAWQPDDNARQDLEDGFGDPDWSEDLETTSNEFAIDVTGVSSSWLPVPYAATTVDGLDGRWSAVPDGRTVAADDGDAAGQDYTVSAVTVTPTSEQIRAAAASTPTEDQLPTEELPEVIAQTANEVTADADTPYDKLIALQDWFRTSFTYSLDAPVEEGFDGTGIDAVVQFLEVKKGYCIHFSGAFALMSQSLGMETRIVVGYLPGRSTGERVDDAEVYAVQSDQLHAWPEVHFEGIGWVSFEPTASLGVPTGFASGDTSTDGADDPGTSTPTPTSTPRSTTTPAPTATRTAAASDGSPTPTTSFSLSPIVPILLLVILVLLLPALVRQVLRIARTARAGSGDAAAAWREVRAEMIDLGIPVSAADTPRGRGALLVEHGADADAVAILVMAVERASYAPSSAAEPGLGRAVRAVTVGLRDAVTPQRRLRARFLPSSLLPRR